MKTSKFINFPLLRYAIVCLLSVFLFSACGKKNIESGDDSSGAEITATLQFSDGNNVDFTFVHKKDDIIKPAVNGPNGNDHYKLWLRGEKKIKGMIYTINLYVTMPEAGVGTYPFGRAWQWHDEGFVTEIHVGVSEANNPLNLKQYVSSASSVDNTNSKGVTITSLTADHVVGTFSGKAAYTDADIVTISNGRFDIDIQRGTWED